VREVTVELGRRSYPVLVGAGARHRLGQYVPSTARKAAVVSQESIPWYVDAGVDQRTFIIDDGEVADAAVFHDAAGLIERGVQAAAGHFAGPRRTQAVRRSSRVWPGWA